jgi:hypothetical protein
MVLGEGSVVVRSFLATALESLSISASTNDLILNR